MRRRYDPDATILASSRYAADRRTAYRSRLALRGFSFHPTNEDFHPSFDAPADGQGGLVGICICELRAPPPNYRIYVCGGDNTAYSRDGFTLDEAREFMTRLPMIITRDWLVTTGFEGW